MINKLVKKIFGLVGYKLIEKKLIKNTRLISEKSILNINTILKILFNNFKINLLIQIGANDGKRFDELNIFIKNYKIKSILVEPIEEQFNQLKLNYQNLDFVSFENSAISVNNEISYLYTVDNIYLKNYDSHIPAISSFKKEHLIKHGVKKNHIIKKKINTISIKELVKKYNAENIDLLYVDTEGYDGKIVYDFITNFSKKPIIIFEFVHIDSNFFEQLIIELNKKEFLYFSINENLVCFPKEKNIFN